MLNDADAAGLAEEKFGAGKDNSGVIVLLTFGTGIGSAVIYNGVLLPNTEFGHLEVGGKEAEHRAASSVKEKKDWSYERWTKEVTKVLVAIENAIWPDLFIAGGGISRKADKWVPLLKNRTPVVAAALQNTAGIVGAAMAATSDVTATEELRRVRCGNTASPHCRYNGSRRPARPDQRARFTLTQRRHST